MPGRSGCADEAGDEKPEPPRAARRKSSTGAIELELGGAIIRIASGVDAATITAVIHAVKAQS